MNTDTYTHGHNDVIWTRQTREDKRRHKKHKNNLRNKKKIDKLHKTIKNKRAILTYFWNDPKSIETKKTSCLSFLSPSSLPSPFPTSKISKLLSSQNHPNRQIFHISLILRNHRNPRNSRNQIRQDPSEITKSHWPVSQSSIHQSAMIHCLAYPFHHSMWSNDATKAALPEAPSQGCVHLVIKM